MKLNLHIFVAKNLTEPEDILLWHLAPEITRSFCKDISLQDVTSCVWILIFKLYKIAMYILLLKL